MNPELIQRYQPGGDIYAVLSQKYGADAANNVAKAANTGDETAVNAAVSTAMFGNPLNTSTASQFVSQIVNDPLAAPLDSLNNQLSNVFKNIIGNPFVLILTVAALVGVFLYFGGANLLRKK